ncbi:resuscitation-promoting factor [Streptomyces sp. Ru73]|uniref:resuscitation-promoting factor n=1 Tax=Streptomyces sp. Ru73 TaxID=2080748 RepID=UPI000CDE06B4|nr:resuscitation-promoting factor [Streptomyces sp. Ru73]POX41567.1 resuscitation-promoting factor [Streptomyces sp. Ru73]
MSHSQRYGYAPAYAPPQAYGRPEEPATQEYGPYGPLEEAQVYDTYAAARAARSYDGYDAYGAHDAYEAHPPQSHIPQAYVPQPYAPDPYPPQPRVPEPPEPVLSEPPAYEAEPADPGPGSAGRRQDSRAGGRAAARRAARRKRFVERPEGLRKLVPQALVVAFLAGGTTAFVAHDKAVRLTVDGDPRLLHTFAGDVGDLLAAEGVPVGPHDIVAPGEDAALASGDEVAVRYGRPVVLTLDGHRRTVWTTARTVEGALRQLGVRAEGAYLSASRSLPIARHGIELAVRTERTVTFMADGHARTVRTNAATVRAALDRAGIALRGQDTTSVPLDSFPREGQTVSVLRVTGTREVRDEPIAYETRRIADPTLMKGTESVVQPGRPGMRRVTYQLRTVNGVRQRPRLLRQEVLRVSRPEVVHVGTAPVPAGVAGADHLNWRGLAQCETGGRADAVDPTGTYGGLYQFDRATWHSLGGSGAPQDAPPEEQTYRAKKLYVSRGASPWPVCGRKLHQ